MPTLDLKPDQLEMLRSAIDSHIYWQLSEPVYRRNGDVVTPGSDVAEDAQQIEAFRQLDVTLGEALDD